MTTWLILALAIIGSATSSAVGNAHIVGYLKNGPVTNYSGHPQEENSWTNINIIAHMPDPLQIVEKSFEFDNDLTTGVYAFTNVLGDGLSSVIACSNVNFQLLPVNGTLVESNVHLLGSYSIESIVNLPITGQTQNWIGSGGFDVFLGNVLVDFSFKFRLNFITDRITISDLECDLESLQSITLDMHLDNFFVDDVLVDWDILNSGIKEWFQNLLVTNRPEVMTVTESVINMILSNVPLSLYYEQIWSQFDCSTTKKLKST